MIASVAVQAGKSDRYRNPNVTRTFLYSRHMQVCILKDNRVNERTFRNGIPFPWYSQQCTKKSSIKPVERKNKCCSSALRIKADSINWSLLDFKYWHYYIYSYIYKAVFVYTGIICILVTYMQEISHFIFYILNYIFISWDCGS